MIDLKKAGLPESVEVEGSLYYIQTSFKYWLRFLELLEHKGIIPNDFDHRCRLYLLSLFGAIQHRLDIK